MLQFLTAVSLLLNIQSISTIKGKQYFGIDSCSAVFVGPKTALTAKHCVDGGTGRMWVKTAEGKSFTAHLLKKSKTADLALLSVECPPHNYVKLGKMVNKGDKVYTISAFDGIFGYYGEGVIESIQLQPEEVALYLVHSIAIGHGSSGSGLFNNKKELVGLNTALVVENKALTFAIDESAIEMFLNEP